MCALIEGGQRIGETDAFQKQRGVCTNQLRARWPALVRLAPDQFCGNARRVDQRDFANFRDRRVSPNILARFGFVARRKYFNEPDRLRQRTPARIIRLATNREVRGRMFASDLTLGITPGSTTT